MKFEGSTRISDEARTKFGSRGRSVEKQYANLCYRHQVHLLFQRLMFEGSLGVVVALFHLIQQVLLVLYQFCVSRDS